jgi:hypothetical protein
MIVTKTQKATVGKHNGFRNAFKNYTGLLYLLKTSVQADNTVHYPNRRRV